MRRLTENGEMVDIETVDAFAESSKALSTLTPAEWAALVDGKKIEPENDWDLSAEVLELRPWSFGHGAAVEMAEAFGIRCDDDEELRAGEKERRRNRRRLGARPCLIGRLPSARS